MLIFIRDWSVVHSIDISENLKMGSFLISPDYGSITYNFNMGFNAYIFIIYKRLLKSVPIFDKRNSSLRP